MRYKNKRGWARLVEAFLSVLLIGMVLIVIVNQQSPKKDGVSSTVYNYEIYMLRSVELNETLRDEILDVSESALPANWSSESFPGGVKNKIANATPGYLSCQAQICRTSETCGFLGDINTDIYAQKIFIASTYGVYNPRQLKLFCWPK
ncbi:MAG: hypothetical protein PHH00_01415 [Candidatus Nanoarchaeia archaeon]|nr:hypothetical protein [Candidatus Nanoarchaeia archaeon]